MQVCFQVLSKTSGKVYHFVRTFFNYATLLSYCDKKLQSIIKIIIIR